MGPVSPDWLARSTSICCVRTDYSTCSSGRDPYWFLVLSLGWLLLLRPADLALNTAHHGSRFCSFRSIRKVSAVAAKPRVSEPVSLMPFPGRNPYFIEHIQLTQLKIQFSLAETGGKKLKRLSKCVILRFTTCTTARFHRRQVHYRGLVSTRQSCSSSQLIHEVHGL